MAGLRKWPPTIDSPEWNDLIDFLGGVTSLAQIDSTKIKLALTEVLLNSWQSSADPTKIDPAKIYGGVGGAHNILDGNIHLDSNAVTVLRGMLILGKGATPKWDGLVLGAAGKIPRSDGTDLLYSSFTIPASFALGDTIYASAANVLTALAGNITTTRKFLMQVGNGTNPTAPIWDTIQTGDLASHVLDSALHTISGKVAGQFLRATGATTYAFEAVPFSCGGTLLAPSAAINVIVWRALFACTVTNVRGYRVGGTGATVNARKNGSLNHLSADLSLTSTDTWMTGGSPQNTVYAVGDKLEIMLVSLTGGPTQVAIQVDFTRP